MNIWATTLPAYIIAVIVWTLGEIIGAAVAPTIIANLAPTELRGLYQGVFGSAWGLSFFIGPLVGTWVFEQFSPDVLWAACGVLGVVLAAGYVMLSRAGHRRLDAGIPT
jgi:MFS family permease